MLGLAPPKRISEIAVRSETRTASSPVANPTWISQILAAEFMDDDDAEKCKEDKKKQRQSKASTKRPDADASKCLNFAACASNTETCICQKWC